MKAKSKSKPKPDRRAVWVVEGRYSEDHDWVPMDYSHTDPKIANGDKKDLEAEAILSEPDPTKRTEYQVTEYIPAPQKKRP